MNFERGLNPKRAMGIGIINWDNLSVGCTLITKTYTPLRQKNQTQTNYIFDCLKKNAAWMWRADDDLSINSISQDTSIIVKNIKRLKIHGTIFIEIVFSVNRAWKKDGESEQQHILGGPIERWRKYFQIIQTNNKNN